MAGSRSARRARLKVDTAVKVRFRLPAAKNEIDAEGRVAGAIAGSGWAFSSQSIDKTDQARDRRSTFSRTSSRIAKRNAVRIRVQLDLRRSARAQQPQRVGDDDTDAPVSARTAIHSVASRSTASTRNAAFSASETATLVLMLRTSRAPGAAAYGSFRQLVGHQRDVGGLERGIGAGRAHRDADVGRASAGASFTPSPTISTAPFAIASSTIASCFSSGISAGVILVERQSCRQRRAQSPHGRRSASRPDERRAHAAARSPRAPYRARGPPRR